MYKNRLLVALCLVIGALSVATVYLRSKTLQYTAQPLTERSVPYLKRKNSRYNIVFYKNGCPYCEGAEYAVVRKSRQSVVPTAFVDCQSQRGKELVREFGVSKAATVVAVRPEGIAKHLYAEKVKKFYGTRYQARRKVLQEVWEK